jgi:hypothetical protein
MADSADDAKVFPVDTRFQQMARRPGGVPRDKALAAAVQELENARPEVEDWLEREVQALARAVAVGQRGAPPSEWLVIATRHCRQLRDVGTTMGLELLTYVTDQLCDILDGITENNSKPDMETIVCYVEAAVLSRQDVYRAMKPDQVPELINGLRAVANRNMA